MSLWHDKESKKRKVAPSRVTAHDRAALRQHYTFLPQAAAQRSTWQGRMVLQYHSHLYKDCVLADMTRVSQGQLGLRWRTEGEVRAGKGTETCGNLHCPSLQGLRKASSQGETEDEQRLAVSYLQGDLPKREKEEKVRVSRLPHGLLLTDYEVPFTYKEQGEDKTELVKLCLCIRCAPLLFQSKGDGRPYRAACRARQTILDEADEDAPAGQAGGGSEGNGALVDAPSPAKRKRTKEDKDEQHQRESDVPA
jgi:hypothetical protein